MLGLCWVASLIPCRNSYEAMNRLGGASPSGVDFKLAPVAVYFFGANLARFFMMKQRLMCLDSSFRLICWAGLHLVPSNCPFEWNSSHLMPTILTSPEFSCF